MSDEPVRADTLDRDALLQYVDGFHSSIRRITHDLSSPLGIIRMAVYCLQNSKPDDKTREEYYSTLNQALERVDKHLAQLRGLAEGPRQQGGSKGENT
jgi:hypothetical protein